MGSQPVHQVPSTAPRAPRAGLPGWPFLREASLIKSPGALCRAARAPRAGQPGRLFLWEDSSGQHFPTINLHSMIVLYLKFKQLGVPRPSKQSAGGLTSPQKLLIPHNYKDWNSPPNHPPLCLGCGATTHNPETGEGADPAFIWGRRRRFAARLFVSDSGGPRRFAAPF